MSETEGQQVTTQETGRCEKAAHEVTHASWNHQFHESVFQMATAATIDRLAADVASIKAKVDAVSPEDVAHLVESEKAWVAHVTEQRDAAIRQLDEARAEVERLKAELAARQADGNRQATLDSSPAVTEPAAPEPAYYLVTNERDMPIHVSRMHPGVGWDGCTITALYAAPQPAGHGISPGLPETQSTRNAAPAAGWLTERERTVLELIAMERRTDSDLHWFNDVLPAIRSILARAGSPPVVEVPPMVFGGGSYQMEKRYRAAMDRAGVQWKEVGRE